MQQPWVLRRLLLLACVLMLFAVASGFPHGKSSFHGIEKEQRNMQRTWDHGVGDSSEVFPETSLQTHQWFWERPQDDPIETAEIHPAVTFAKKRKRRDVRALFGGLLLAKDLATAGIRAVQKVKHTIRQLRPDEDDDDEPLEPIDVDAILRGQASSKGNRQGRQNGSENEDQNSSGQDYGPRSQLSQQREPEEWGYE